MATRQMAIRTVATFRRTTNQIHVYSEIWHLRLANRVSFKYQFRNKIDVLVVAVLITQPVITINQLKPCAHAKQPVMLRRVWNTKEKTRKKNKTSK